ncbi:MAG: energy-coupling factor transporter ATPase [Clostridia bacterium]|nr:energy-coupling factor transporter ATPase [Clostridia bacterium]
MSQIEVKNLSYKYGVGTPFEVTALDNISFSVEKGEFIGLIGHTGSGKSTLLQCFNGLLKPEGELYIDGVNICEKNNAKGICFKVGLVFQYPEHQLFEDTVYKDIAFGPKNMGLSEGEIKDRVCEALKFSGLSEEILEKSPFELSGGQKRRVAVAGVIAMRPEILVLDEPAAGLDPIGRDSILANLREYHKKEGKTVILSSHNMDDIARNCEKVLVMNSARLEMFETISEVFKRSERLKEIGLDVPMLTSVFEELLKEGYPVNSGIYTVEQAVNEIIAVKDGGKNA